MSVDFVEFVNDLKQWHEHRVEQLLQVLNPEFEKLQINGADYPADGDFAKGFKGGVSLALQMLGELPFVIKEEDDDGDG